MGRPKGSKNKSTILRESAIERCLKQASDIAVASAAEVVQAMVDKARKGDTAAAKLILDRIIPARRSVDEMTEKNPVISINITASEVQHGQTFNQRTGETVDDPGQESDGQHGPGTKGATLVSIHGSSEG